MLENKDYCDRDTAVALQKLGYNNKYCRDDGTPVIVLYEAQKWLREGHNLHIEVRWYIMWYEYEVKEAEGKVVAEGSAFPTYEEALSTAVRMAVEHLKEK